MKMNYNMLISIFIILTGVVVFIISFFSQTLELKIALSIASLGLIGSGIIQLGQIEKKKEENKQENERFNQIMDKLEKIEEKLEQPKNAGVAIADVLASGLKYYTEHMNKPEKEEEK
jgi:Ethanolamine utilization protein EutJ (predicted chaperonin)